MGGILPPEVVGRLPESIYPSELSRRRDPGSRIITQDTGEEWRTLRAMQPPRALSWDEAMAWLRGLPNASSASEGG
jgi:hypothetical protein